MGELGLQASALDLTDLLVVPFKKFSTRANELAEFLGNGG